MDFYVNGEKIDVQLESEQTVGDVLRSFAEECEASRAAVIGITVNGKKISAEIFDSEAEKPISGDTKFEFEVITELAIKDSFRTLSSLFEALAIEMEQIPGMFINGKAKDASESIKKLADSIDKFCHVAALASLFPETFKNTDIGGASMNEFFGSFSPVLLDFEEALKNEDSVLVGDLCEYEICPRLREISEALKNM